MKYRMPCLLLALGLLSSLLSGSLAQAQTAGQLIVDLSAPTGAVKHGAAGSLYGMGNDGIPSVNMLAPLSLQVIEQKPEGGLQHPNGDALNVSNTFKAAGGREIQIAMQDIYAQWPYENLGLNDYLGKVDTIVQQVLASPNRSLFSFVPFNEPDWIWYNRTDRKQAFFNDWRTVYQRIRALDPNARIVGPNFSSYDATFYRDFFTFCKANNCLPDVTSWHELGNDFFGNWYSHYNDYRQIESSLGLTPRAISINEYGRSSGDLGNPGQLVQWIARFETSKVDASLAYWTSAGSMSDLVTPNNYNQATGSWWLYKWYGEMTGTTLRVTPPNANAQGLQGLAALDSAKKQLRVVFGGTSGTATIVVRGFSAAPYLGSSVHATVWSIAATGSSPSGGPVLLAEGDYTVANGEISVPVSGMSASSAYQVIVTPNKDLTPANSSGRYEAEYAALAGGATVTFGSNTGYSATSFVEGYGGSASASTSFVVTASANRFYTVRLRYSAGPLSGAPTTRTVQVVLNGAPLTTLTLPGTADWNTWADAQFGVFLTAGINRIAVNAYTNDDSDAVNTDYIELTPGSGTVSSYEAEASSNTLSGAAVRSSNTAASGGQFVGYIGNGTANTLQFNNVNVPTSGTYRMVVTFANAESRGDHAYNSQIVDRFAEISSNGGAAQRVYFRNTFSWSVYQTRVVDLALNAGNNTIRFANSSAYAPDIDKIEIAAPLAAAGSASYTLVNRNSGKCLDVEQASLADGANVLQWVCNGGANQRWRLEDVGGGYSRLVSVQSGKVLEVASCGTADGADVRQWSWLNNACQQWTLPTTDSGYVRVVNRNSGKVLDVANCGTADGVDVRQWSWLNNACQQWRLQP